jgi:hypothetical protein
MRAQWRRSCATGGAALVVVGEWWSCDLYNGITCVICGLYAVGAKDGTGPPSHPWHATPMAKGCATSKAWPALPKSTVVWQHNSDELLSSCRASAGMRPVRIAAWMLPTASPAWTGLLNCCGRLATCTASATIHNSIIQSAVPRQQQRATTVSIVLYKQAATTG